MVNERLKREENVTMYVYKSTNKLINQARKMRMVLHQLT